MSARKRPLTARDLWTLARVGEPAPAPDGRSAVVSVKRTDLDTQQSRDQLWLITPGGTPRALTAPEFGASAPTVSPDGRRVAFLRTPAGKTRLQVHVMPLDGGEPICVTDLPLGALEARWLPDPQRLIVLANLYREALTIAGTRTLVEKREKAGATPHVTEDRVYRFWDRWLTDGQVSHLFLVDPATREAVDLLPDSERWFDLMDPSGQFDIAPDGSELTFSANNSRSPHTHLCWGLYTLALGDTNSGPVCITGDHPADCVRPRYSPDGNSIIYGRQEDPDHYADKVRLARWDRAGGAHTVLTEAWDRSLAAWEFADARTLVLEAEDRGRSRLFVLDPAAPGLPRELVTTGTAHAPRPAGGWVWFQQQSLCRPPELSRVPLGGGVEERCSHFNDALLAEVELGQVEELELAGAGGAPVQVYLVLPPGFERTRKWPLVHLIHGGPHGIFGDQWHFRWNAQALAAPGYVLAMVNFHGSSSFGQRFTDAILGDWGGKAADDILAVTDQLLERGFVDPARMAITGGSFGGYMSAWLATRTERFACGIAHAAVYNLPSKYGADVTQGLGRAMGANLFDGNGQEVFTRWNPAAHTAGYRTPMLVIHGEKDYRVPVTHGLELYGVLKAKGVPARLVYYPDENHWILKPQNSLHWYGEFLGWLERYLGPGRQP